MVVDAVRKILVKNFREIEAKMNKEFQNLCKMFALPTHFGKE